MPVLDEDGNRISNDGGREGNERVHVCDNRKMQVLNTLKAQFPMLTPKLLCDVIQWRLNMSDIDGML